MSQSETPTDAFGDSMVWIDSYGDYLPQSENIPTAPVQDGVSGVTHDGEIYCVDCAIESGIIERSELSDGSTRDKPWTGVVLPSYETDTLHHCGSHAACVNALDGDEHPYNHDEPVGIGIEERPIQH
jgi:hypothetical protein